ncbi:hypothetical protein MKW94_029831, partial [Papaver nudicaule]|nr:hypothetical protein [Papaver nudicaule]
PIDGYREVEDKYESKYSSSEDADGYSSNSDDEYVYLETQSPSSTRNLGSSSLSSRKTPSLEEGEAQQIGSEDRENSKRQCFGLNQLPSEKDQRPTVSELLCKSFKECGIRFPSQEPGAKLRMMMEMEQSRPSKQKWVDSWFQSGSPKLSEPANNKKIVVYTINVYGYSREKENIGGYGVILRDDLGRPIVSSFGISACGHVSFLVHEFQGLRGGLQHVRDFKLVANQIQLLCKSQTTVEVLKLISHKAADIIKGDDLGGVWQTVWRCFPSRLQFLFEGFFRPLIKEISELYLELPPITSGISAMAVDKCTQKAAEYVAKLGTAGKHTQKAAEYVAKLKTAEMTEQLGCYVVKMELGEYPEKLQNILYQDAFQRSMGRTKRGSWEEVLARRRKSHA